MSTMSTRTPRPAQATRHTARTRPPEETYKGITARAHRLLEVFLPDVLARDTGAQYDQFRAAMLKEAVALSIDLEDEVERQMAERGNA